MPRSELMLVATVALWLLSCIAALIFDEYYSTSTFVLVFLAAAVSLMIYALFINAAGRDKRMLQALSAIIGCGAVLTFIALFLESWLPLIASEQQVQSAINLIILWSIAVEGHIIARTINRRWFVGFVAAFAVFIVQLFMLASLAPVLDPRPADVPEQVSSSRT